MNERTNERTPGRSSRGWVPVRRQTILCLRGRLRRACLQDGSGCHKLQGISLSYVKRPSSSPASDIPWVLRAGQDRQKPQKLRRGDCCFLLRSGCRHQCRDAGGRLPLSLGAQGLDRVSAPSRIFWNLDTSGGGGGGDLFAL